MPESFRNKSGFNQLKQTLEVLSTVDGILASSPGSILGVPEFFQSSMLPRFIDSALLRESEWTVQKINS